MVDVDRFPLRFERSLKRFWFKDPNLKGSFKTIRTARILCQLCGEWMTEDEDPVECLIDTGAPISVVPLKVWSAWPKEAYEWFEPFDDAARKAIEVRGFADQVVPARLGRVTISLRYTDQNQPTKVIETPAFSILAKFMTVASKFDRIVLGIDGNAMASWQRLEVDFQDEAACLVSYS